MASRNPGAIHLGHDFIHHALAANIPGKELLLFQMSRAIRRAPDGSRL
jgi:hypothetical protein